MGSSCTCAVQPISGSEASYFRQPSPDVLPEPLAVEERSAKGIQELPVHTVLLAERLASRTDGNPLSLREAAYLQRKCLKKRSFQKGDKERFLSYLPEVEADIAYRFSFVVLGDAAEQAVAAACGSDAARSQPGGEALCGSPKGSSSDLPDKDGEPCRRARSGRLEAYRCLCPVSTKGCTRPAGWEGVGSGQDAPLAKLAFHPLSPGEIVPPCASRLEASSTVVVFAMLLDARGDIGFLEKQLWAAAGQAERSQGGASHRPRRALILCLEEGASAAWADGRWAQALAPFEQQFELSWKFGPVQLADADALHRVFAEMASNGIIQEKTRSGEQEEDDSMTRIPSSGSLDHQPPPLFETECDGGGECAEEARKGSSLSWALHPLLPRRARSV